MLGNVLQGPPMVTHAFEASADTRKKREPPTHTHQKQTNKLNRATQAKKKETKTTRRNATKTRRTDKARRSTSRTQDHGRTGKPTTVPLTPGSKTRVLQTNNNEREKKTKQTNKQHVSATHVSYQNNKIHNKQHKRKPKQDPGGRKGNELRVDQPKVEKGFLPPPSGRLAILPIHEGVGRDGLSARGG